MGMKIEYNDNSNDVLKFLDAGTYNGLTAIGFRAETYAKKGCPVDTGLLRNSITFAVAGHKSHVKRYRRDNKKKGEKGKRGENKHEYREYTGTFGEESEKAVYIGTNVEYAPYVEFGARGKEGKHMFRNAVTNHTEEYKRLLAAAIEAYFSK